MPMLSEVLGMRRAQLEGDPLADLFARHPWLMPIASRGPGPLPADLLARILAGKNYMLPRPDRTPEEQALAAKMLNLLDQDELLPSGPHSKSRLFYQDQIRTPMYDGTDELVPNTLGRSRLSY